MGRSIQRRNLMKAAGAVAAGGAAAAASGSAPALASPAAPGAAGIDFIPFIPQYTLLFPQYEYIDWTEFAAQATSIMYGVHNGAAGSGGYPSGGAAINLIATLPVPNDARVASVNVQGKGSGTFTCSAWLKDMRDNSFVGNAPVFSGTKVNPTGTFALTKADSSTATVKNYHKLELLVAGATSSTLLSGAQVGFYPDKQGYSPINPARVYDSRTPQPSNATLPTGQARTVSVKDARDLTSGAVTTANRVPEGAYAISYNLTITSTTGNGYIAIYPKGGSLTASATNWGGLQTLSAGGVVALGGDREVTVEAAGNGSAHFIIDVTGYYI